MNGCIIMAINSNGDLFFISNTGPILWTGEKSDAKIFRKISTAKSELEENKTSLSETIMYCNIVEITIIEYKNGTEIGREKFL